MNVRARARLRHPARWLVAVVTGERPAYPSTRPPQSLAQVLTRVRSLPVSVWSYGYEHPDVRHMGPMAQDFGAWFGLGSDPTRIEHVDAVGVLFAAVKALDGELLTLQEAMARVLQELEYSR